MCVCVCLPCKIYAVSFMCVWDWFAWKALRASLWCAVFRSSPSLLLSWISANWKKRQKSVVLLWRKEKSCRGEAECNKKKKNPSTFTPSWNGRSSVYAYRPFLHKEALVAQIRRISWDEKSFSPAWLVGHVENSTAAKWLSAWKRLSLSLVYFKEKKVDGLKLNHQCQISYT